MTQIRRKEERKGTRLGTSERIGLEKKLATLKERENNLRQDTSEQWQRDAYPERLEALAAISQQRLDLEDQLLNA